MPFTTLDPKTALIVIDMQKGITAFPVLRPLAEVSETINGLLDAFHRHELPVVLVVAAGGSPGRTDQPARYPTPPAEALELLPDLRAAPGDQRVTKYARGAFSNTGLEESLKAQGVTQVVIVGVSTSNGVESSARQAYEAGFNVTLPVDAMTDGRADAHEHSLTKVFPRLAETGTAADVIALLDRSRA